MMRGILKSFVTCRSTLLLRSSTPVLQQKICMSKSVEEKLGLPSKPKRPLSPFFRFMAQVHPIIKKKNPEAKPKDIVKIISEQWKQVNENTKTKLAEDYKAEITIYSAELLKYNQHLSDEQRQLIKSAKEKRVQAKESREYKKKLEELGRPKKPPSAYIMFLREKMEKKGSDQKFIETVNGSDLTNARHIKENSSLLVFHVKLSLYALPMKAVCHLPILIQLPPWENDKGKARQRPGWKRQGISTNSERLGKRPLIWNIIPFYQKLTRKNQTFEEKLGLPAKPKKPDTPFFQFRAKVYSEVKEKYPEAGALEIVKKITELWRNLDEKIKSSMVEDYKAQLKSYSHELAKYHYELTDDQRELLKSERQKKLLAKQDRRQKVELKKKLKELGKPKKPPKAFALFLKSKMDKEHQPIKLIKATTKFSKEWQNLDENEKKIYLDEAKQKYEIYKRDLQAWEEKMICLGNIDVVREESLIEPRETGVKSSRKAKSQTVDSHKQKIKSSSDNRSSEIHEEDNR